ncbi:hypothetical protein BCR35DRAFT_100561 [Leucosporidium creatinivorum]|uniref:Zn(2)-C6 fungal-type domain-containing protein n=1 Tax=Leucosporidium creatinivorum TaxID=106004 RepID=A0A1Y2F4W9_9BASI|nr:hypothetical protein BCR35DRAFT_100561 [Leucosporidium creatinivorum]
MQTDAPDVQKPKPIKKAPRAAIACLTCRRKRIKCSGEQPVCSGCAQYSRACEWNLEGDKRKPYTREVVEALQQQIVSLEAQVAALSTSGGPTTGVSPANSGGPLSPPSADTYVLPHSEDPVDGGLATNAHGEVRFYGPGSAMSVLADAAASTEALRAAQHAALTQAAAPQSEFDYAPPPTPPVLAPELQSRLLSNAFGFALAGFQLVDERAFYAQLIQDPSARTQHYSPFMLNVLLGIGCRYLDPAEAFPERSARTRTIRRREEMLSSTLRGITSRGSGTFPRSRLYELSPASASTSSASVATMELRGSTSAALPELQRTVRSALFPCSHLLLRFPRSPLSPVGRCSLLASRFSSFALLSMRLSYSRSSSRHPPPRRKSRRRRRPGYDYGEEGRLLLHLRSRGLLWYAHGETDGYI